MFAVTLVNNSGTTAVLKPNGDLAGGVPRYVAVEGYPVPVVIRDCVGAKHVPESWAVEVFDGQNTFQLGYEGNGMITVTVEAGGQYTASSGCGDPAIGQLVPPIPQLPAVQGLTWSPPNPVGPGTAMTASWNALDGASAYDVTIVRDDGTTVLTQETPATSVSYVLASPDMFHQLTATLVAHGDGALPSPAVSSAYYCGNSLG